MVRWAGFPWVAAIFAALASIILVFSGLEPALAVAVFVVWAGSLWLSAQKPPAARPASPAPGFDETQMRDLFELSQAPVIVTKRDRVTVANAAARRLFGAHMVGQDIRVTLRHPRAVALIDKAGSSGATIPGLVRRRDVWRINRKVLPGGLAVFEFVNRTAEADISRAHTDFVANASHELRTPLASIIGYVETLQDDAGGVDAELRERFLSTIQREAQRLQALVDDLMSLSRIEAEKHDVPREVIDFSSLAERAARDAAGAAHAHRLTLAIDRGVHVCGDRQQLEQMVRNLIDNAFKYGSAHTPVEVRVHVADKMRSALIVRDRGEGIAAEHLPHLTRRFYRTDPGRSRASGGTGLGLAIVKHIVERHRGKLDIASTQGDGTMVTVLLPAPSTDG
ncbi:sensor histidine kinase [Qipengyuania sediminis]|uniref:sensor histidine kinase n=1 Tax=Qipengyuania sediminis TaxID=1532023 RepID=UPI00105A5C07|nr:ATP-binding protein [Qipengyuania sediminis]